MSTAIQPQRRNKAADRAKRRAFAGSATQYVFEELRRRIINFDLEPGAGWVLALGVLLTFGYRS